MRKGLLLLCLAVTAAALSACSTMDNVALTSNQPGPTGGGGSTGGTGGEDPNPTGTPGSPVPSQLPGGDTAYVFNSNGSSFKGFVEVSFPVPDFDSDEGRALVVVDPNENILGWPEPILMGLYKTEAKADNALKADYREYRRFNSTTDAELQYWEFSADTYAGQYRVLKGGNASATKNMAWFFGGQRTEASAIAARQGDPTAYYEGEYGFNATVSNWMKSDETVYDPNREWRGNGSVYADVKFAEGKVQATLTPKRWDTFLDSGLEISLTEPSEFEYAFQNAQIQLEADINRESSGAYSNTFSGITNILGPGASSTSGLGGFVDGETSMEGGFFGEDGGEITGIFTSRGTLPEPPQLDPTGGDVPVNDDRRPTMQIQGAFHGREITNIPTP